MDGDAHRTGVEELKFAVLLLLLARPRGRAGKIATRIVGNNMSTYSWNARGDVAEIVQNVIASQGGALQAKTIYIYKYR